MGLGNLTDIKGCPPTDSAMGAFGKSEEVAHGKDTTTGHWEMMQCVVKAGFALYPNGFPKEAIKEFEERTGRKVMVESNLPASGTTILDELGEKHLKTGEWIVYTSADSVFQLAAHEEIVPIPELYNACKIALDVCNKYCPVARVIARPFIGTGVGKFERTPRRHDYSVEPPEKTTFDKLKELGFDTVGVGKTYDIFACKGFTKDYKTNKNNEDGILKTIQAIKEDTKGIIFTNLVDFDMVFGHRRDWKGYGAALEQFDAYLPQIIQNLKEKEILIVTADHGCDPTYRGTDHTREHIPILVFGKCMKHNNVNIGTRKSFADIGATVMDLLTGSESEGSFAKELGL